ncbi:unnamed protein product [Aspergillus oryzae]|uniref:Unnamed protein product n=1 Tax=Aspergillus oryzae TaxID=5062 RepID=A0AAN4YL38_ASPOZ|nr:unnamed protein product [Aspergillus oryzae]GMG31280.1 unnamed protein product [Aspergillus oryzae]
MAGWGFPTAIKGLQYLFAGHDLGSGIKAISKFSMRNSGTEIPSPCVTALARLDLGLGDASDNDILVWIFFKLLTVI